MTEIDDIHWSELMIKFFTLRTLQAYAARQGGVMNLKAVELHGFKGQERTVLLDAPTLIVGPNGAGKSAVLEGLIYCLTGQVPTGREAAEVAKYFPPDRGGSVRLVADDGVLERCLVVHKGKISQQTEYDGEAPAWRVNEAMLDLTHFLALSANKRREFILELCGSGGKWDSERLMLDIKDYYAKEIAGIGATAATLEEPLRGRLPDRERDLASIWGRMLRPLLESVINGSPSRIDASQVLQRLAESARQFKNTAARKRKDAESALKELEGQLQGAQAAAGEVEKLCQEYERTKEALSEADKNAGVRSTYEKSIETCKRNLKEAVEELEKKRHELDDLPDPASEDVDADAQLGHEVVELSSILNQYDEAQRSLFQVRGVQRGLEEERKALQRSAIGRALEIIKDLGPLEGKLLQLAQCVEEIAADWLADIDGRSVQLEQERRRYQGLVDELAPRAVDAAERLPELKERHEAAIQESKRRGQQRRRREELQASCRDHEEIVNRLSVRIQTLEAEMGNHPVIDYAAVRDAHLDAMTRYGEARKAQGVVESHALTVLRLDELSLEEDAWKRAERAIKRAREVYVADVAQGLLNDVRALLEAAGRKELPYLLLENERGRPIFDIGWEIDGSRRSISSLSGGEAVLFCAAISIAIARSSGGLRILLIEADPLDDDNAPALLRGLGALWRTGELHACLVATHQDVVTEKGWKLLDVTQTAEVGA